MKKKVAGMFSILKGKEESCLLGNYPRKSREDFIGLCHDILEVLREGTILYNLFIDMVKKYSKENSFSLEEAGTSNDELESLRIKGCLIYARDILNSLRTDPGSFVFEITKIREEIEKGNLSLAQIGTTEDELESLRVKGHKEIAIKCIERLRRGGDMKFLDLGLLIREINNGDLTLDDIGITPAELSAIVK